MTTTDSAIITHSTDKISPAAIGKIPDDEQITVADTGWSEADKEHMRRAGYDDMDMIRAWYS